MAYRRLRGSLTRSRWKRPVFLRAKRKGGGGLLKPKCQGCLRGSSGDEISVKTSAVKKRCDPNQLQERSKKERPVIQILGSV